MEIINEEKKEFLRNGLFEQSTVHFVHVKILDIEKQGNRMRKVIEDTSWLNNLDAVEKISYSARAEATIREICSYIREQKNSSEVTKNFGEYLVSLGALEILEIKYQHKTMPVSELIGMKSKGNPGFDFFSQTIGSFLVVFGEAKYSLKDTTYKKALKQVNDFMEEKKDEMSLIHLQNFFDKIAVNKIQMQGNEKAVAVAFSINIKDKDKLFEKILKTEEFVELAKYPEIYLIGVEVSD